MSAAAAHAADASSPERAKQARCVATANRADTLALLATVPTSADDLAMGERLFHRARVCERALLRGPREGVIPVETRGQLAEQLLAGQPLPATIPGAGTRRFAQMDRDAIDSVGANRATLMFYDVSACVADRDWTGARILLGSEHGSAAERTALMALAFAYQACLNGVARMAIPPAFARAAIAEEVWARLNTSQVAAR